MSFSNLHEVETYWQLCASIFICTYNLSGNLFSKSKPIFLFKEITVDRHRNTHTETKLKYFDGHSSLSQSEENDIRSLLIEKDGCLCRNISILFPCVCSCACPPWSLQFLIRVLTFLSFLLFCVIRSSVLSFLRGLSFYLF